MYRMVSGIGIWFLYVIAMAQGTAAQVWTHLTSFQSSSNYFQKIVAGPDGTFYIGGYAYDSLMLDTTNVAPSTVFTANGRTDCFILRTSTDCKPQVVHRFGGFGNDQINDLVIGKNGNFVVTGRFQETMVLGDSTLAAPVSEAFFVAELSSDSTPVWCRATDAFSGYSLDAAENGDVVVAGQFRDSARFVAGTVLAGYGDNDLFYARYDATGKALWAIGAGSRFNDHTPIIVNGPSGGMYLSGVYFDTLFFDGAGDTMVAANDEEQSFIVAVDSTGKTLWKKAVSSDAYAICHSMTADSLGYLYVTGRYSGVLHIDTMTMESGNEHSMFLARIAPDGTVLWIRSVDLAIGYHVALGNDAEVMVSGTYQRNVTFGSWSFTAKDIEDIFVVGYTSGGECTWVLDGGCCRTAVCTDVATNGREYLAAGSVDGVLVGRFCNINFSGISVDYDNASLGRTFLAAFDPHGIAVSRPMPSARQQLPSAAAPGVPVRYYDLCGRDVTRMVGNRAAAVSGSRILIRDAGGLRSTIASVR